MSSGSKITTAIVKEATAGVAPTAGWLDLPRTSFGLKVSYGSNESNEIGSSRMSQAASAGTVNIGGDVGSKLRYSDLTDDLLASTFGSNWVDNKLTIGDENITFSLATTARDIGVHNLYTGCRVSQLALTIPNDNDISMTTTFAGTGYDDRYGGNPYYSILDEKSTTPTPFDFKNVVDAKINGESVAGIACIDSFNITFNNNVQTQRCLGNGTGFPGNQIATTFAPTGQIKLAWSPKAYDIWKKQKTREAVSFEFTLKNANGAYTFLFPQVQLSGDWPDAGANDIVQVQLDIKAERLAPTVTRVPATK